MRSASTKVTSVRSARGPAHSLLSHAVACALLLGFSATAVAQDYQESGEIGDPDSWLSDEFKADWGLGAINAHHAYARGLSGAGVPLGILDTGVMADHPEFDGSGRLHPVQATVEFLDSAPWVADGGADRLVFGDHGSHTAGTVAASRNGFGMHGVAFGADLFAASGYALDKSTEVVGEGNEDNFGLLGMVNKYLEEQNKNLPPDRQLPFLTNEELLALLPEEWSVGSFDSKVVAAGTDQLAAQGVRVISNSWGTTADLGDTFEQIAGAYEEIKQTNQVSHDSFVRAVRDYDVLFVFAAGNSSDENTLTHADVEPTLPAFIPELKDNWVSVVSVTRDLVRSDFSSICGETRDWCIAAPGSDITSIGFDPNDGTEDRLNPVALLLAEAKRRQTEGETAAEVLENVRREIVGEATPEQLAALQETYFTPVGIDLTQPNVFDNALSADVMLGTEHDPLYKEMSGTSMATPHVSGTLGLLFERFPYLTATQVRDVMFTTATDLGEEGVDEIYGWGLINLEKAIEGPGMLRYDTMVDMDQAAGGAKVWEGDAWDDWTNDIDGPGRLFKKGAGWLRLSGDNSFAGASVNAGTLEFDGDNALTGTVEIVGGTLILNGSLQGSEVQVYENGAAIIEGTVSDGGTWVGGWLGGNGTLSHTTVAGTVAPGDGFERGIGTLTFNGDYTQAAGSVYRVDLASDGSDLVAVGGSAELQGGAVAPMPGESVLGRSYRILSADGGVTGSFGLDTSALDTPFLVFELIHSPFAVDLDVSRGASFASAAGTWNQVSVATSVDGLADSDPLLQSLVYLNVDQATAAFDQLSGELYPSLRSALVESSRAPRAAVMQRAGSGADGFAMQAREGRGHGLWIDAHRGGGHIDGDGNARRIDHSTRDLLVGYDHRFGGTWQIGAMIGTGRTDFSLPGLGDRGRADNRLYGVYGGGQWGGFGARAAWLRVHHDIDTERRIAFAGFDERATAAFTSRTRQAVIEAGYRFGRTRWEVEPFLQYANIRVHHGAVEEAGGLAALHGPRVSSRVNVGTLGARFDVNLNAAGQEQTWLSLRGMLGYRRAGGHRTPETWLAFDGGAPFNVRGVAVEKGAMVAEAGFAARTSAHSLFEFGYSGQFGGEAREHGVNARFSVRF